MVVIALIDDDPISTFLTEKLIAGYINEPFQIFKYQDASEALEQIPQIRPNYLFLDLNMPIMDGWDFLEQFNPDFKDTKVYILSSSVDNRDMAKAGQYSLVQKYLSKPLIKQHIQEIFS